MDSRYNYDEHSQTWPVFTLSVLVVTLIPFTIQAVSNAFSSTKEEPIVGEIKLDKVDSQIKKFRSNRKPSKIFTKKNLFILLGWLSIGALIYHISITEVKTQVSAFDPYDLLGVEYGTSEKDIKSHFRKLSIKFHPDKQRNLSEDEKLKSEEHFVLLTKAYKALTEETTRENYEKYGHPDGPQQASHGIALPKFLIEGKSSPLLLALYIVLIGGVLPYFVSSWWSKTKTYTKKGIHVETANLFVEKLLNHKPSIIVRVDTILTWLSEATEFKILFPNKSNEEIFQLFQNHLNRKTPISDDQLKAVAITPSLIAGLIDFAASFRNTEISNMAVETLKHLVQAVPESTKNELLQLPNVDQTIVQEQKIVRLGKLLTLGNEEIKKTLGIKDDLKLKETLDVATNIPILKLIKAEFKVPGEVVVTPESTCYISVKVVVKSAKHHGETQISEDKLKENDTLETLRDPYQIVNAQPSLPKSFAPFFPTERRGGFVALTSLQKDTKITESPAFFQKLSLSNLELTQEQYKDGSKVSVGTFKIPITSPTPAQEGKYQFRVVIKSTDYFTQDLDFPVIMHVQNPPRLEEVNYDIPDPDEDSLAGAVAQMKGEKVKRVDDDSDDEDSEFEEELSDFEDINTDTEDEAEGN
ncbi:putative membrane protein [Wickerhamomyces ciferrii]|uniref:Membrane protein n=1 Tax=Wickerhamomyces ciferrii (strain ATCC 14091 / BCRC 22168 / CBS 111 / JCM 3599 / NBRC 0793 / NRRL Y-1031 F-60-10) TaxID=1206466 RepID=K0KCX9_WICCF|nr:uncharacterized protein BN7_2506 [Wickerhamomyces ciferrii]CCH42960.1 putative membrane protein [Wickerhamomyces ciferrii]